MTSELQAEAVAIAAREKTIDCDSLSASQMLGEADTISQCDMAQAEQRVLAHIAQSGSMDYSLAGRVESWERTAEG